MLEDPRPIRLTLEPLDDFVVIEQSDEEAETRGGLIIPASAETQCRSGIVTAVGAEADGVAPGDKVLFPADGRLRGAPRRVGDAGHAPARADRPHPRLAGYPCRSGEVAEWLKAAPC